MSKLLAGIIVAMGVSGYMYYQLSIVPMKNEIIELTRVTMAQELRNQEQLDTIAAIKDSFEIAGKALQGMQIRNQQYEDQMSEYLDVFRRHNVSKLASAKPGLLEKRVNAGTKEVFDAISEDSVRISRLND
jgi:hypothetical protein|tara:strand:- start:1120 stop:1512 length:393 start_codon:yes stop_codon:yes gene_type:complete